MQKALQAFNYLILVSLHEQRGEYDDEFERKVKRLARRNYNYTFHAMDIVRELSLIVNLIKKPFHILD